MNQNQELYIYYIPPLSSTSQDSTSQDKVIIKRTTRILQQYGQVFTENTHHPLPGQDTTGLNITNPDLAHLVNADVLVTNCSPLSPEAGMKLMYALTALNIPILFLKRENTQEPFMIGSLSHPLLTNATYTSLASLEKAVNDFFSPLSLFKLYPNYLVYDAIDGAGKGAIHDALKELGKERGLRVFDAVEYFKKEDEIPLWEDVKQQGCDLLLVCEPTYTGIGKVIRKELTAKDSPRKYSALSIAHAYALNRETLFKRLVMPALNEGIIVGSDRGVITSEHYQPAHAFLFENTSWEYFLGVVRGLPGNRLALAHVPGLLIIPHVKATIAMKRLEEREEKDDNSLFEVIHFQQLIARIYRGPLIKDSYQRKGSHIIDLNIPDGEERDVTKQRARKELESYLKKQHLIT